MDQIEPSIGPLVPVCMELPLHVGSVVQGGAECTIFVRHKCAIYVRR